MGLNDSMLIDLNSIESSGSLSCPYCGKGKLILYGKMQGKESSNCAKCGRLVLWDFDDMRAFKAKARKFSKIA